MRFPKACDQHSINNGNMQEIVQLPKVIQFVGQTYVMPGTLSRLWCIFEMAYSLLFNSRLIYYSHSADEEQESMISALLEADLQQLTMSAENLLKNAKCFKKSDAKYILGVIDENFDSRELMVTTIKAFIRSSGVFLKKRRRSRKRRASLGLDFQFR